MKFTKDDFIKILKDTAVIFGITLIAGILLGFVYELTKNPIAEMEKKAMADACNEVFKETDASGELVNKVELSFDETEVDDKILIALKEEGFEGAYVDKVYEAKDSSGALYGYVIGVVSTEGYGGNISFYMGITVEEYFVLGNY